MTAARARAWRPRRRSRSARSPLTHRPMRTPASAIAAPAIGPLIFSVRSVAADMTDSRAFEGGDPETQAWAKVYRHDTPPRNRRAVQLGERGRADRRQEPSA